MTGCFYQDTPASHFVQGIANSKAPSLSGRCPASSLLRAYPPPFRRWPISRCFRLYSPPCSTDFSVGRGRFLQLLDMPLSPCCPYHPAGVTCRFGQPATCHTAFAPNERARPPRFIFCRGHLWVHFRYGPVTRSPSHGWLCRSASSVSFPPQMRPKLRGF